MAGEINLTVSADIGDLRRQLEQIPGITAEQARLMVAELDRGYKRAEKAAASAAKATKASMAQAAEATKRAADAGKGLEDSFGKVGGSAAKLAGGLDLLAPGMGDLARGLADLADVGEVASGSMGLSGLAGSAAALAGPLAILGLALTPIIVAFMSEQKEAEAAAAALGRYEAATKAATEANNAFNGAIGDVNDELKLIFGLETQNEQAARRSVAALEAKRDAANASAQALIDEAKAQQASIKGQATIDAIRGASTDATAQYAKMAETIAEQTARIEKNNDAAKLSAEVFREKAKADDQAERNAKRLAAAEKVKAERIRAATEAERIAKEAAAKHAEALAPLLAAEQQIAQNRTKEMEQSERLAVQLDDLRARKLALAAAGQLSAQEAARFTQTEKTLAEELTAALLAEEAKRQAGITAKSEETKKNQEAQLAADIAFYAKRAEIANGVADVVSAYSTYKLDQQVTAYEDAVAAQEALGKNATEGEKKRAAEETQEKRRQAMIAFAIDKAAKLAQALTAAALATINALATPPAPNYIAAGLAAAGGAVQVATIAATRPTFHSGGMADFAPDEASAIVRRGEAVLSPAGRAAIGDDTIRAANAGMGSGQTIVVQQVYRHRVFDSFVTDNLRTRGPLSRALGAGARAGQRRS